jgi:two-component system response regulator FixJ
MDDRALIVYVIDDDEAVRDSLQQLLRSRGILNQAFGSAADFLAAMVESQAGCVLADIHMPGMSGLELQSRLLEMGQDIPVIVMTGNADVPSAVRALKSGAVDFIEKPISTESLISAIESGLRRRRASLSAQGTNKMAQSRIAELTPRERDVLRHLVAGHPNKIIAYELGISPRTVENHRAHLMLKMQVNSVAELVKLAIAAGLTGAEIGNS